MTDFEDWHTIETLLMTYAEHIDAGQFAQAAALFEHATYRIERAGQPDFARFHGSTEVQRFFEQTRIHADGTPRTKHTITNVLIEVDGDRAIARCYATVFQQTDELPLQPIASGCYIDRFERVDGRWWFADRALSGFLLGDRSQHITWNDGVPDGAS